jgi:hypothetical protein
MNCDSVKDHLVDFLYDAMPAEVRAAFSDHVRGCASCHADVATFQKTLGNARAALSGPLAAEPPARIREAVMKAATAAAAAKARTSPRSQEARKAAPSEPGFFARLLRAPWLLPAFGAASVATVVFLVRVLKNPEVIPGQRPHSIEERAAPARPAPATVEPFEGAAAAKAPQDEPPQEPPLRATDKSGARGRAGGDGKVSAAEVPKKKGSASAGLDGLRIAAHASEAKSSPSAIAGDKKKSEADFLGGFSRDGAGSGASSSHRFAQPPPPRRPASSDAVVDEFQRSPMKESAGPRAMAKDDRAAQARGRRTPSVVDDDMLSDVGRSEPASAPARPLPTPEPTAATEKAVSRSAAARAEPPLSSPPMAPPRPAAAPSPPPTRPASAAVTGPGYATREPTGRVAESEREMPSRAQGSTAGSVAAPKPAVAAKPAPAAKRSMEEATEAMPPTWDAEDSDSAPAQRQHGPSLDESVRRADRLFVEQSWNAAAEAYRDLLRRFPSHRDAAKWRGRMNQSMLAEQEHREAAKKAAKAKAVDFDSLSGSKR